jgi:hypothetical protein
MQKNPIEDLAQIRAIMERSSKFLSLSGLSGVAAGVYAILGGLIGRYWFINDCSPIWLPAHQLMNSNLERYLAYCLLGATVVILSIISSFWLTTRNARSKNLPIWNIQSKRLLFDFFIPMAAGGFIIIAMINHNEIGIIPAFMLLIYGLTLMHIAKHSIEELKYLGLIELLLSIISAFNVGYGWHFWMIGFGLLHICYGTYIWYKYERN